MRIFVIGGDGFCGWPTVLHLSARGHEVWIIDNQSRRRIDAELGVTSLTPIRSMHTRIGAWRAVTGHKLIFEPLDVAQNYEGLRALLEAHRPDAIVHFGEQRSAPYSMKSARHKRYTVDNNLNATNNLLAAVVETGCACHIVHLGTMGVYGYEGGVRIPEGYLPVTMQREDGSLVRREILYPSRPGSVYHMTKAQDQLLFEFYNRNDGVRVTDLHQGIVWGTQTAETALDPRLINRFDYDGDYGTVLNRFLMQAVVDHPLTVHGTGGQTRAFIHISDTCRCIELALQNPPKAGARVRILNQMTEVHRVFDLARMVAQETGAKILHLANPRNEAAENDLMVSNHSLLDMGLDPVTLSMGLAAEVMAIAKRYAGRCDLSKILAQSYWSKDLQVRAQQARRLPPVFAAQEGLQALA